MAERSFDVVIVGYGPTAQVLALALGRQGRSVAVVERWENRYPLPRAVHIDHEIYRILAACGLEADLASNCHPGGRYQWFNAQWQELMAIDQTATPVSGGYGSYFVNQPVLEDIIDAAVAVHPNVELFLGYDAQTIAHDGTSASVVARRTADGTHHTFTGDFLVGCDGANSLVAREIGTRIEDLGFQEHWLVVDVELQEGATATSLGLPEIGQYCDPVRPTTIVPGGIRNGRILRRWEFMKLPGETIEELESEARVWELLSPWVKPDAVTLVRHKTYNFRSLLALEWREGRVLLAGDAAHLTPPFLGQGLCSGVRDAWALAWRLGLLLDGKADLDLLASYTPERLPHVRRLIEMAIYLGKVICISDPEEAARRDMAFASGTQPPFPDFPSLDDGLFHRDANGAMQQGAGLLAPHVSIANRNGTGRMDDLIGTGPLLVIDGTRSTGSGRSLSAVADRWQAAGGKALVLGNNGDAGQATDLDGRMADFMARHQWLAMVVRPDFHVFGGARDDVDAASLVALASRALTAGEMAAVQG